VIRILTDDKNAPIMAFGCVATLQSDRMYWISLQRGAGKPPDQLFLPSNFKSGTWTVARVGGEVVLNVQVKEIIESASASKSSSENNVSNVTPSARKGAKIEVARKPCTKATLQGIHVWSIRQESGNAEAKFLLRRLQLLADGFISFKDPPSDWSWGWIGAGVAIVSSLVAVVIAFRRRI
jgi:hypothetical protein